MISAKNDSERNDESRDEPAKNGPEDQAEEDGIVCYPCEEGEKTLAMRAPVTPSRKEIEEHELTHCPSRA